MAEWSKAFDSKSKVLLRVPQVQILFSPPEFKPCNVISCRVFDYLNNLCFKYSESRKTHEMDIAKKEMADIIIIGGGPSGLMAAYAASNDGHSVILLEKNSNCGRKLLITGSGKCNITNSATLDVFMENFPQNNKFLYPAFKKFFSNELEIFFNQYGVIFKTEDNGKVFPTTQKAQSVLNALIEACLSNKVKIYEDETCTSIQNITQNPQNSIIPTSQQISDYPDSHLNTHGNNKSVFPFNQKYPWYVKTSKGEYFAKSVIIATGGMSYPKTGSTGDGYAFAIQNNHEIIKTRPGLVPFVIEDSLCKNLSGVSVKDTLVNVLKKSVDNRFHKIESCKGDLLFTHFGISGPPVLLLSRYLPLEIEKENDENQFFVEIDLLPEMLLDTINKKLLAAFASTPLRQLKTIINKDLDLPLSLAAALIIKMNLSEDIIGQKVTKDIRKNLIQSIKALRFKIKKTRGYQEAMITCGGVSTKQINPKTMESLVVPNLFFCGEVIDIDGDTGGYNLQAAFSTGYLAGISSREIIHVNN